MSILVLLVPTGRLAICCVQRFVEFLMSAPDGMDENGEKFRFQPEFRYKLCRGGVTKIDQLVIYSRLYR